MNFVFRFLIVASTLAFTCFNAEAEGGGTSQAPDDKDTRTIPAEAAAATAAENPLAERNRAGAASGETPIASKEEEGATAASGTHELSHLERLPEETLDYILGLVPEEDRERTKWSLYNTSTRLRQTLGLIHFCKKISRLMPTNEPWARTLVDKFTPCVRSLTLQQITPENISLFLPPEGSQGPRIFPLLTALRLEGHLRSNDLPLLARILSGMDRLTHLGLRGISLKSDGLTLASARDIQGMEELFRLNLIKNTGNDGLLAFAEALPEGLTHLDLSRSTLDSNGAAILAPALRKMTGLTQLNLGHTLSLDATGIAALAPALPTSLTELDLCSIGLDPMGAPALALALYRMESLRRLNLSGNRLETTGVIILAPALPARISDLNLSMNYMGDKGVIALAQALATLKRLTALDLGMNRIGDAGVAELAKVSLKRLAHLWLNNNQIGPNGAIILASALPEMTGLTALSLRATLIDKAGVSRILDVLRMRPKVKFCWGS